MTAVAAKTTDSFDLSQTGARSATEEFAALESEDKKEEAGDLFKHTGVDIDENRRGSKNGRQTASNQAVHHSKGGLNNSEIEESYVVDASGYAKKRSNSLSHLRKETEDPKESQSMVPSQN